MRYDSSLMAKLTKLKQTTPRQRGRRTKHLFDWMAHARNLSKGSYIHCRNDHSRCTFCGSPETQQHINVACSHPLLVELRHTHWRHIDTYRHHNLPIGQRWIVPIIEHMEDHLWSDTELGGDNWNGRLLEELLPISSTHKIAPADLKASLNWMRRITLLLQHAQRALYSTRHLELMSKEAKISRDRVTALRRRHRTRRTQNLYDGASLHPSHPLCRPSIAPHSPNSPASA
jgi:hypothetical protein